MRRDAPDERDVRILPEFEGQVHVGVRELSEDN
jgi:hypothetical protein